MEIRLYTNYSDPRVVSKNIELIKSGIQCSVKHDYNVMVPHIVINGHGDTSLMLANYMYIPDFRRYYYITVTVSTAGELQIDGKVDVLMSHNIRRLTALVLRQEHNYSPYFPDNDLAKRVNKKYVYKQIGIMPKDSSYVLTVDGGDFSIGDLKH